MKYEIFHFHLYISVYTNKKWEKIWNLKFRLFLFTNFRSFLDFKKIEIKKEKENKSEIGKFWSENSVISSRSKFSDITHFSPNISLWPLVYIYVQGVGWLQLSGRERVEPEEGRHRRSGQEGRPLHPAR